MKIKLILMSLGLLILGATTQAQTQNSYADKLRKYYEYIGGEGMFKSVINEVIKMEKKNNPIIPDDVWSIMEEEINSTSLYDLFDELVPVYKKYFSEEDLDNLLAFYATPSGQKFAKHATDVAVESMQIGQEWGMKLGEKVGKRIEKLMEEKDSD